MRVLVNGLQLSKQFSGVQYYLENFLIAFSQLGQTGIELFVLLPKDHKSKVINNENIAIIAAPINCKIRSFRILYEHLVIPYLVKKLAIDTLFCPSYILPFFIRGKSVVVIHDLIALDFPKLCSWGNAAYFRYFLPRSIKKAGTIITGSIKVKENVLSRFDIPPNLVSVIKHGIPPRFKPIKSEKQLELISAKYSLPENFILFVGNIEPKKNIEVLLDAFSLLNMQDNEKCNLVLVGQLGWKYKKLMAKILNTPFKERIYLPGYVDEQDLPGIYNLAQLLVLPSIYGNHSANPVLFL
ncbi:MAG: glycosyltransferase family 4 protein [Draconibacterium sp.]